MARGYTLARSYRGGVCMTKAELVEQVAAAIQVSKHQTDVVITQFLEAIMEALHTGKRVKLRGFGSFRLRHRHARAGRNPRTGDTLQIPAMTLPPSPRGKPSKRGCILVHTPQG